MDDAVIPLAADFPAPSREDWMRLVEATLKGGDFERRLVSRTSDGLAIQPLYTREDGAPALAARPAPALDAERGWDLRSRVDHPDPARANADALVDLRGGASSVLLAIDPAGERGAAIASADDLERALEGVLLDLAPVALDAGFLGPLAAEWLARAAKDAPAAPLAFHLDPLSAFAEAGESPGPIDAHVTTAAETAARLAETYPKASQFLASGRAAHEAGGTEAQELGMAAAAALAYARALVDAGLSMEAAFEGVVLGLAADGEVLTTIAKLRAVRAIWARLTSACGVDVPARIEARSSRRMLAARDAWVNLLRLTAAGFGAGVGGAEAVVLDAFTQPLGRSTAFARRQARNTQLVLMEEAGLGRVADPAGGAWALERLTDDLARAGWAVFQGIEAEGGLARALESGHVAALVASARGARAADVARRKAGLIGASEFANLAEAGVEIEAADPAAFARPAPNVRAPGGDSRCPPLSPWRASAAFEALRARAETLTPRPRAVLATLGPVADHAARVGFARNLLAAGGIEAETVDAAEATSGARLAVICGSDDAYAANAAETARGLKAAGAGRVLLAGRPGGDADALASAGVDGFVHAGGDAVMALSQALDALGAA